MKLGSVKLPSDKSVKASSGMHDKVAEVTALGSKNPSDSAFWDAIDEEIPPISPPRGGGWGQGSGKDGWEEWGNDGLDDLEDQPATIQSSRSSSSEVSDPPIQSASREVMGAKKLSTKLPVGANEPDDNWSW